MSINGRGNGGSALNNVLGGEAEASDSSRKVEAVVHRIGLQQLLNENVTELLVLVHSFCLTGKDSWRKMNHMRSHFVRVESRSLANK